MTKKHNETETKLEEINSYSVCRGGKNTSRRLIGIVRTGKTRLWSPKKRKKALVYSVKYGRKDQQDKD